MNCSLFLKVKGRLTYAGQSGSKPYVLSCMFVWHFDQICKSYPSNLFFGGRGSSADLSTEAAQVNRIDASARLWPQRMEGVQRVPILSTCRQFRVPHSLQRLPRLAESTHRWGYEARWGPSPIPIDRHISHAVVTCRVTHLWCSHARWHRKNRKFRRNRNPRNSRWDRKNRKFRRNRNHINSRRDRRNWKFRRNRNHINSRWDRSVISSPRLQLKPREMR